MSNVIVNPGKLTGTISMPPSKSQAHRAIICAALAKGKSEISPIELSADIRATINAVRALGAKVTILGNTIEVDGTNTFTNAEAEIDCGESGSTLRFMLPIAAAGKVSASFAGSGKLPSRPIDSLLKALQNHGVASSDSRLPFKISGALQSGLYEMEGNVTSQYISGLLFALPILDGESEIRLTTPLESAHYVKMTIDCLKSFGVTVKQTETGYSIKGGQSYIPQRFTIESDWSQAAFFLAAGALSGDVTLTGLNPDSAQGDKAIVPLLQQFGAKIEWQQGGLLRCQAGDLKGININASDIPDLVPILSIVAAFAKGTTTITGAGRLRCKESNRLLAVKDGLERLGVNVRETCDGLVIEGRQSIGSSRVDGYNDHRIVMSMAIAALRASGPVEISDMESINKSFPTFFEKFGLLGGTYNVVNLV